MISRGRLEPAQPEAVMKLFVDTGSVKDIEALASIGILDGVTTNPTLLSKEGGDYRQVLKRICDIVKAHRKTADHQVAMERVGRAFYG